MAVRTRVAALVAAAAAAVLVIWALSPSPVDDELPRVAVEPTVAPVAPDPAVEEPDNGLAEVDGDADEVDGVTAVVLLEPPALDAEEVRCPIEGLPDGPVMAWAEGYVLPQLGFVRDGLAHLVAPKGGGEVVLTSLHELAGVRVMVRAAASRCEVVGAKVGRVKGQVRSEDDQAVRGALVIGCDAVAISGAGGAFQMPVTHDRDCGLRAWCPQPGELRAGPEVDSRAGAPEVALVAPDFVPDPGADEHLERIAELEGLVVEHRGLAEEAATDEIRAIHEETARLYERTLEIERGAGPDPLAIGCRL